VGQAFARLGAPDPRLTPLGVLDYRLASLFRAWSKADPSSHPRPTPATLGPTLGGGYCSCRWGPGALRGR
jgi:hypothetical protein